MYILLDALALAHCASATGLLIFLCLLGYVGQNGIFLGGVLMVLIFYPQNVKGIAHGAPQSSCR
jgi:nitrate/nitrite transporter NarK